MSMHVTGRAPRSTPRLSALAQAIYLVGYVAIFTLIYFILVSSLYISFVLGSSLSLSLFSLASCHMLQITNFIFCF
jgi:hypothetical protein